MTAHTDRETGELTIDTIAVNPLGAADPVFLTGRGQGVIRDEIHTDIDAAGACV